MKTYLNVPYSEKEDAKKLGAKWDIKKKKWYIENLQNFDTVHQWLDEDVKARREEIKIEKDKPLVPLSEKETPWLSNEEIKEKLLATGCYTFVVVN